MWDMLRGAAKYVCLRAEGIGLATGKRNMGSVEVVRREIFHHIISPANRVLSASTYPKCDSFEALSNQRADY